MSRGFRLQTYENCSSSETTCIIKYDFNLGKIKCSSNPRSINSIRIRVTLSFLVLSSFLPQMDSPDVCQWLWSQQFLGGY